MTALSVWSIGHFLIWAFVGRFLSKNWTLFLLASTVWEVIERYIPMNFARETLDNTLMDIVINILGFSFGLYMRPIKGSLG